MARKRVVEAPSLHSWEDVNDALRQIAEAQIALGEIQSDMQKQILGAQKVAEEQSKPLNDNVAKLEREIKSFFTDHRDEMGKTKSMVLTFGEVGHAGELRVLPQGVGLAVAAAGDYDAEANVLLTALAYTEHGLRVPALKEYGRLPRLAL